MNNFPIIIHQTILAIDEKLGQVDNAAYRLRLFEQWMQKNKEAK